MGHYAGEMGYSLESEYSVAELHAAGFTAEQTTKKDYWRCSECGALVVGRDAMLHFRWHRNIVKAILATVGG